MFVKIGDAEILEVVKTSDEDSEDEKKKLLANALNKAKGTLKNSKLQKNEGA